MSIPNYDLFSDENIESISKIKKEQSENFDLNKLNEIISIFKYDGSFPNKEVFDLANDFIKNIIDNKNSILSNDEKLMVAKINLVQLFDYKSMINYSDDDFANIKKDNEISNLDVLTLIKDILNQFEIPSLKKDLIDDLTYAYKKVLGLVDEFDNDILKDNWLSWLDKSLPKESVDEFSDVFKEALPLHPVSVFLSSANETSLPLSLIDDYKLDPLALASVLNNWANFENDSIDLDEIKAKPYMKWIKTFDTSILDEATLYKFKTISEDAKKLIDMFPNHERIFIKVIDVEQKKLRTNDESAIDEALKIIDEDEKDEKKIDKKAKKKRSPF